MAEYRIRWAVINIVNSKGLLFDRKERRCIAEKEHILFGFWPIWMPVDNAEWRQSDAQAMRDIEEDKILHDTLPPERRFTL